MQTSGVGRLLGETNILVVITVSCVYKEVGDVLWLLL